GGAPLPLGLPGDDRARRPGHGRQGAATPGYCAAGGATLPHGVGTARARHGPQHRHL
ncbi:MAG: hypothetical protein AVDCRST_MAG77-4959, partial [uncultured Chloroflexi bacterium]